jgi:hypothetical protein
MPKQIDPKNPFSYFEPFPWHKYPNRSSGDTHPVIYSTRGDHGIKSSYKLHNPNDAINIHKPLGQRALICYTIRHINYDLFTVDDFYSLGFPFDESALGNIEGELAERIARRITKYFLKHFNKQGKTGGIFDKRFTPQNREGFIVAHTDEYIMKIKQYPHLIILKKTGKGKYGYENIKELDGFFDYRFMGQRHIIVLESKLEKLNINIDDCITNLFIPLRQIFGDARFTYILFTDRKSVYHMKTIHKRRQLKQFPLRVFSHLKSCSIPTLFFTFNESKDDFHRMAQHIITQYRAMNKTDAIQLRGKTIVSHREIAIFDEGETPHIKLVKDPETSLWREVNLRYKKKSSRGK